MHINSQSSPVHRNLQVSFCYVTTTNSEWSYFSVLLYISLRCTASLQNDTFYGAYLNTYEDRTSPLFISSVNNRFLSAKNEQQDSF
jgi:hypothetical protein